MLDKLNYRYETLEIGDLDVHLRSLKDIQEFQDIDNKALDVGINDTVWPIFGVLWPSGFVMATIMEQFEIKDKKILEIGCGLGLSSLVLKLRNADITATDYNPAVETFLKENTRINQIDNIPFFRADWTDAHLSSIDYYDLIVGSDILYESSHTKDLAHFINKRSKKNCVVMIIDANRGHINRFTREMKKHHFIHEKDNQEFYERFNILFKGSVNFYIRTSAKKINI